MLGREKSVSGLEHNPVCYQNAQGASTMCCLWVSGRSTAIKDKTGQGSGYESLSPGDLRLLAVVKCQPC